MTDKFFNQLSQDFTQLLESEYDYNVVIEIGEKPNNKLFKAHSIILHQRSLYFRQILTNATKKNNIIKIKLPHVTVKAFNVIIEYIYGGIISLENFEPIAMLDLLVTVNFFMLTELVEHIQYRLLDNNSTWLQSNFFRVYQLSFLYNNNFKVLQQFCNNTIVKHPNMIFNSNYFTTLQEDALIALLKNDDLQMEESEIWDKVIQWGKAKTSNLPSNLEQWTDDDFMSLKGTLRNCLPHIRFFQIIGEDIIRKIKPYQIILEKNLWDDILVKNLAPNMPINSPILPPRKKVLTTTQLSSNQQQSSSNVSSTTTITSTFSSIITLQHSAEISSWIDHRSTIYEITEIPYEFKLLLRGSRDGFTSEKFHKLCDNHLGTVIVLKVKNSNEILGGYNPLIWKVGEGYATTSDSFIFSLEIENINKSIISRVNDKSYAIMYSSISRGPYFGDDLAMGDSNDPKKWYYGKSYYQIPIRNTEGWFLVDDYEVFQICKKV